MNTYTEIFLVALLAGYAVEYWLSSRQASYVRAHRDVVPEAFRASVSLEEHQKAADYTLAKAQLGLVNRTLGVLVLLIFTLGGGIQSIADIWNSLGLSEWMTGVATVLSVMLIGQILEWPLSYYQTFYLEQRFGFNRNNPVQFFRDALMQLLLGALLLGPLLALLLALMQSAGESWWLIGWAVFMSFTIFMSWAFPTFIAPLFNTFTPLSDQVLARRIETLLDRCGFRSQGIFVMDGSRRSGHGNAYFTGIGNNKRIVFFDTLLESLSHDEVEAVLAHELGHFKCRHVLKMLVFSALLTLAGFATLGWLAQQNGFFTGLGVTTQSMALALLLFILVLPAFTTFLQPISAWMQRRNEFEADDFAAGQTRSHDLVTALVKLYRENAATLTPDPVYSAFYYSHPPASIRIAHLERQTR